MLDTHIAFWLTFDQKDLTPREFTLIRDPDTEIIISVVAVWELRLKWHSLHRSGDRKGPLDPMAAIDAFHRLKLPIIALEPHVAATQLREPMAHKDPFDELLLVQAQVLDMKLLTRDGKLKHHPLAHFA